MDSPVILRRVLDLLKDNGIAVAAQRDDDDASSEWIQWVDKSLAVLLFPNITRNFSESWQAFGYISDVDSFSPVVRDRVLQKVKDSNNFGEYCHDPIKARRLLMNLSYSDLTIPGRAADFRTGVEWRLMLRPSLPR